MKCPICEMNVWKVEYRPDINIISLHCINCSTSNIDIDVTELYDDWKLNNPKE